MAETPRAQKSPLWMRITLFGSLAVNLLIAGAVIGFVLTGGADKRSGHGPGSRDAGSLLTRALSQEDRRALRKDFMAELRRSAPNASPILDEIEATLKAVRAVPFDAEAFATAVAEQSSRRDQRDVVGRKALTARVAAMTDAERAAYADRVEAGLKDLRKRFRR